jgi:hypothetical protein
VFFARPPVAANQLSSAANPFFLSGEPSAGRGQTSGETGGLVRIRVNPAARRVRRPQNTVPPQALPVRGDLAPPETPLGPRGLRGLSLHSLGEDGWASAI